jgi:hypothetical protein
VNVDRLLGFTEAAIKDGFLGDDLAGVFVVLRDAKHRFHDLLELAARDDLGECLLPCVAPSCSLGLPGVADGALGESLELFGARTLVRADLRDRFVQRHVMIGEQFGFGRDGFVTHSALTLRYSLKNANASANIGLPRLIDVDVSTSASV